MVMLIIPVRMSRRESIHIKNLGPLTDVEIDDIKSLTVLIGDSGSGKSTILKTLAMFQWVFKMMNIRSYLALAGVQRSPFRFSWDSLMGNAGFEQALKKGTEITYTNGNCAITYKDRKLNTSYKLSADELSLEKISFISDKRNLIPDILSAKISKKVDSFYLNETLEDFKLATRSIKLHKLPFLGVNLSVEKTNNGEKFYIKGRDGDYKVNFEDASSGMQNVTSLSVIVDYFSKEYDVVKAMNQMILKYLTESDDLKSFSAAKNVGEIAQRNIHIHIEEPELSLYPERQKELMDSLIECCFDDESAVNMSIMMATHSPYIVNYINLLTQRAKHNVENATKIAYDGIDVYEVADGTVSSLKLNDEKHLVDTRLMSDPISDIYREYNSLNGGAR